MAAMREFNTEGPVVAEDHYCIPPLERIDLQQVLDLVRRKKYFVLHAPRQTGKTSALLALRDLLNSGEAGEYRCVYANFEVGQAGREDTLRAMRAMLGELARRARMALGDRLPDRVRHAALEREGADGALIEVLSRWAESDARPLVLLIDEIDALVGDTLLSVLRQLRAGYDQRPEGFPHSIVLCGVRDVRDYRIYSTDEDRMVLGGSAFNIKSKSLRLGDFSTQEIGDLTEQHTEQTGQMFTAEALASIEARSAGQPWLVNALCREACFESAGGRDRSRPVTADAVLDAQERLILRRDTHIDDLANKLREERVRRVIEPILTGADAQTWSTEDVAYARDLGLVTQDAAGTPRIANPIYAEVLGAALRAIPRGRAAATASGAPAAHGQRRRTDRTGVRAGAGAGGPADRVAAGRGRAQGGSGVQGTARGASADRRGRGGPDARLRGPMRGGGRAPDRVRPLAGAELGREDLSPRSAGAGSAGHGVGHVIRGVSVRVAGRRRAWLRPDRPRSHPAAGGRRCRAR